MRVAAACFAALLGTGSAAAQRPPLVTDRPDFTESAVAVSSLQVESGYTFSRSTRVREHALGEVLVRVPLIPGLEARLGLNSHVWMREAGGLEEQGFEDASLGAKLVLAGGSEEFELTRPAVAVLAGTTVPTGAAAFRERALQPEAKLAVAWPLSGRAGLSSNLNYAYASDDGERYHQLAGSLSLGYALAERLGSYAEIFGFAPEESGGSAAAFVNGGLTVLLAADLQLDVRAGTALRRDERASFAGIGLALRL